MKICHLKIKSILSIGILLMLNLKTFAQVPQPHLRWVKTIGNTKVDEGRSVLALDDGGFIVACYVSTPSIGDLIPKFNVTASSDLCVIRYDANKNIVWKNCYGGTPVEQPVKIIKLKSGDFMVGTRTASSDGDVTNKQWGGWDAWLLKIDTSGNIKWSKTFGTNDSDFFTDMITTMDGGLLISGSASIGDGDIDTVYGGNGWYDCFLIKIDSSGTKEWGKNYGGTGHDHHPYVIQGKDSMYYMTMGDESIDDDCTQQGFSLNGFPDTGMPSSNDIYIAKLDQQGNILWHYDYGGSWNEYMTGGIVFNDDNTLYIAGETQSDDYMASCNAFFDNDILLLKIDTSGKLLWSRCVGGSDVDECYGITSNGNGGCVVFGRSRSSDGDIPFNYPNSTGGTTDDAIAVNIDGNGNTIWGTVVGGTHGESFWSCDRLTSGNFILSGKTTSPDGNINQPIKGLGIDPDILLVELSQWPLTAYNVDNSRIEVSIFPNPTSDFINLRSNKTIAMEIELYDIQGRLLYQTHFDKSNYIIDVSSYANGIYFLALKDKEQRTIFIQKISKQ